MLRRRRARAASAACWCATPALLVRPPYHLPPLCCAGAAGGERGVLVWDPRKWVQLDRWSNCTKYEITGLHFASGGCCWVLCGPVSEVALSALSAPSLRFVLRGSLAGRQALSASTKAHRRLARPAGNPRLCYVAGIDYEVLCGEWGGNRASRLGGGNRAANATHTGLRTGPAGADGCAACSGCAWRRLRLLRLLWRCMLGVPAGHLTRSCSPSSPLPNNGAAEGGIYWPLLTSASPHLPARPPSSAAATAAQQQRAAWGAAFPSAEIPGGWGWPRRQGRTCWQG